VGCRRDLAYTYQNMKRRFVLGLMLALVMLLPLGMRAGAKLFVPEDFQVPLLYVSQQYKLKPLGPKYVKLDYDAYMSSIQHLQQTFTFSKSWPHAGISMKEALEDVQGEEAAFAARKKFTYAVLNMVESRELGCVYISPSDRQGYDAVVRMWVTKNQAEIEFDKRLAKDMQAWLKAKWPFQKVAFVGWDITREEFAKLPKIVN
jgi:hypothetical protein